jgi:hypothetical protein
MIRLFLGIGESAQFAHLAQGELATGVDKFVEHMEAASSWSISIKSNLAQEKVCESFNVGFFQAIKLIYGYALRCQDMLNKMRG